MNGREYIIKFSATIRALRKKFGMTQESLAEKLGVRFQVISKWENEQSHPDIELLPQLADVFDVGIDELFGRSSTAELSENLNANVLPWEDNETIVMAVFKGHKLLENESDVKEFHFKYDGDLQNVNCRCNLECDTVEGDARVGSYYIECDTVGGDAHADNYIECETVECYAKAGGYIKCDTVGCDAYAGNYITCDIVGVDANAGDYVKCSIVRGNANAEKHIECGIVEGDANAGDYITCDSVGVDANAEKYIECGIVKGDVNEGGNVDGVTVVE